LISQLCGADSRNLRFATGTILLLSSWIFASSAVAHPGTIKETAWNVLRTVSSPKVGARASAARPLVVATTPIAATKSRTLTCKSNTPKDCRICKPIPYVPIPQPHKSLKPMLSVTYDSLGGWGRRDMMLHYRKHRVILHGGTVRLIYNDNTIGVRLIWDAVPKPRIGRTTRTKERQHSESTRRLEVEPEFLTAWNRTMPSGTIVVCVSGRVDVGVGQ
jgi:hypothetical protein